jgi:acetyltransferase-like isoleucine patch superfamily enzyme
MKSVQSQRGGLVSPTARVDVGQLELGEGAEIGDGVVIEADRVVLRPGAVIEADNRFSVGELILGHGTRIERGGAYRGIAGRAERMCIGDYSRLGASMNVLVPELRVGDYTALHNSMLISGYKPCVLGHNCWVGQQTILNSTERLQIGNNVRIGTQSQLWTHIASGELLEGCTLFGEHPLVLEDNVWIVGGAVISPNLVVREGTVVMVGSVLTKSTEPRHCYAGTPARDITDKIRPYEAVTLDDKLSKMKQFVEEFHASTRDRHRGCVLFADSAEAVTGLPAARPCIVIVKCGDAQRLRDGVSVFSLDTKRYAKNRTELEVAFIRFLVGYRARFLPLPDEGPGAARAPGSASEEMR